MSRSSLPVLLGALLAASAVAEDLEPFAVKPIASTGRTVAAEIADFDGDGRADLLEIRFDGIPPADRRSLRVHFQGEGGEIPPTPQLEMQLPTGAAAYDIDDLRPEAGAELLLLWREGVRSVSFSGRKPRVRDFQVPGAISLGAAADERGLSRLPMTSRALGPEPVLVVPGLGDVFLLGPAGELRARLDVSGRANYFIQPPGPLYAESDIQIFFDAPRFSFGDIDGDGRGDVLSATRHELRVFPQQPDGSFSPRPSRRISMGLVSLEDHMRGSGAVRATARDINGDGRLDLMISATSGGVTDAESTTSIHFNRGGSWDLAAPDLVLRRDKTIVADQLFDVDGDGRLELMQARIPVTLLELLEVLATQSFDAHLTLYRLAPKEAQQEGPPEPWFERKLALPFSFDTARLRGFIPSLQHDLNGDGFRDFLHSDSGKAVEIYLGGDDSRYRERAARQELNTEGVLRGGDLNGDGLTDLVLCNPRRPDAPIWLLTNRGVLPGTQPGLRRAGSADPTASRRVAR